ncbi:pistil-specific extensin-like protein [Salvia hispanica]|uniref:pistil-specific extensin-like protein n=1 Tax=Salvia hispanica TaxID=49212 RepID=UPI002009C010|nr:pistil-specific extensin-like protein [Salvia hispanica]XP_047952569.1 pistil-specific extensin-like protein [Salvia hispanica]
MGAHILFTVAAALLLLATATTTATPECDIFHVTGSVLCQECGEGWNEWVNGANPIQGSKVSVTCLDERSRVVQYASDLTDEAGNFDVACNKYVNGKKLNPQNCYVRLVSSPDPVCNVATNFAGGKTGVKLHRPNVVYRDILKYALGSFYYTTPMCDDPDTNDQDDSEQNNY